MLRPPDGFGNDDALPDMIGYFGDQAAFTAIVEQPNLIARHDAASGGIRRVDFHAWPSHPAPLFFHRSESGIEEMHGRRNEELQGELRV